MVALFVTLDMFEIGKHGLNINEYLTLMKLQHDEEGKTFPYIPDENSILKLLERRMIEWDVENKKYILDIEGKKVFDPGEDLFEEFFALFPNAVDTGFGKRAISAKDPNSISGKNTHDIWRRITKNKPNLQGKIIDGLKRELEHKRANNSMAYLQGIDTWLRQATWEKWEDIPDKKGSTGYTKL